MAIVEPFAVGFGAGVVVGAGALVLGVWVAPAALAATRPVLDAALDAGAWAYEGSKELGAQIIDGSRDLASRAYEASRRALAGIGDSVGSLVGVAPSRARRPRPSSRTPRRTGRRRSPAARAAARRG